MLRNLLMFSISAVSPYNPQSPVGHELAVLILDPDVLSESQSPRNPSPPNDEANGPANPREQQGQPKSPDNSCTSR